jgi:chemosensory pili system protein ChpA (sensor histidine kinase/response regulator)
MNRRAEFDAGPLSWVKPEIDLAMQWGAEALRAFAGGEAAQIAQARASLHQAHGALQIVGLNGITEVSRELEAVLAELEQGTAAPGAVEVAGRGFAGLCAHLDGLMSGQPHQALRLLPLYQDLCGARAEAARRNADPVDLFHPKLDFRPPWREKAPLQLHPEELPRHLRELRARYIRGFLAWMKGLAAGAADMHAVVDTIEQGQSDPAQRLFWWVACATMNALANGALEDVPSAEQRLLCNRIEAQIRRHIEGARNTPERVLREVLYVLAQARPANELIRLAQDTCQLAAHIPSADAGTPAPEQAPALHSAREQLRLAKDAWTRYAADTMRHADSLAAYAAAATALAQAAEQLDNADLAALAEQLTRVGGSIAGDAGLMSEAVALEVATALLLLENALDNLAADAGALGTAFAEQSGFVCARLASAMAGRLLRTAPDIPLLDEMSRQAQERLVLEQVVGEMQANLHDIEQVLDAFFRNPAQREPLAGVNALVHQLTGALAMLGEAEARDALAGIEATLQGFADPGFQPADETSRRDFETVAQTLSALGFHIAALARGEQSDFATILRPSPKAQTTVEPPASDTAPATGVDVPVVAATVAEPDQVAEGAEVTEAAPAAPAASDAARFSAEAAVDAELLQVFLEEAEEVLANTALQQARLMANPVDQEALVSIRRGFHTLKGSGRMVGLDRLGEAAWTVEQALNWWLREERPASGQVLELIAGAHAWFAQTVSDMRAGGHAGDDGVLSELAEAVKTGKPARLGAPEPVPVPAVAEPASASPAEGPAADPLPLDEAGVAVALDGTGEAIEARATSETTAPDEAADAALAATLAEDASSIASMAAASMPASPGEPSAVDAGGDNDSFNDNDGDSGNELQLGDARVSTTVFTLFSGEAHALMNALRSEHETLKMHGIVTDDMIRAAHTLAGIAGTVQLAGLRALGYALEHALEQLAQDSLSESEQGLVGETIETLEGMVEEAVALRVPDAPHVLIARLEEAAVPRIAPVPDLPVFTADPGALLPEEEGALQRPEDEAAEQLEPAPDAAAESAAAPPASRPLQRREQRLQDELDAQLLPLFLEEAAELVPAIGEDLRSWHASAGAALDRARGQSLHRRLHTLKGSARMAGAMAVGDLTHHMESKVESALAGHGTPVLEELDGSYDRLCELVERLRHPKAYAAPAAAAADPAPAEAAVAAVAGDAGALPAAEPVSSGPAMLRVRADAVDRMVDQTGEISIARSRIESELRGLKGAMQELTDNVLRLRAQLREIEIQAESQMQAANPAQGVHAAHAEGFDPLEFDRFTRFQELTRIMAESVNDVQTVHQNLLRSVEGTDAALAAQARLNRELQQDLMRVRMVAFGTLSERLYRVVRQTAKDAGKRANLDVRGGSVELDRAVLERMTGPIEHVLRNAVTHGIETPAARVAAGKPEIGDIRIEVSQEGGEIRIVLSDDGAGLDLARIRAKAVQSGLLAAEAQLADEELANFIFHAGFSTAVELTQSAGRGVGMDVVRSEVAGLGGRIELGNRPGQGLALTIYLPLTLAVMQVVMVRTGTRVDALPAVIVEQVMQYRPEQLSEVAARGHVDWNGRRYPLRYLPHLLGEQHALPETKRLAAVLLMRSGASALALQVDEIQGGNQEVVVKAMGPQLQSVPGVTGVTLLGSGDIVLILNPVPLVARAAAAAPAPVAAAVAELPPLVLVVDDSLTVRKITGRLLERQGYTVATARDGVEALEKLKEGRPDVMLVDIEMPRMDGFELTRHVRADAALSSLPVIMISSRTADKHRNVARELGVNVFLGKPYQEDELLAHIRSMLHPA